VGCASACYTPHLEFIVLTGDEDRGWDNGTRSYGGLPATMVTRKSCGVERAVAIGKLAHTHDGGPR
jgi:hypothetical protein